MRSEPVMTNFGLALADGSADIDFADFVEVATQLSRTQKAISFWRCGGSTESPVSSAAEPCSLQIGARMQEGYVS
jgi:hypothetical protein